jgi:hypothetical protein
MSRNCFWLSAFLIFLATGGNAWGWGRTAHKFINQYAVPDLPAAMAILSAQQAFLISHASDADSRKSSDTAEAPKHFIDLESYPDFQHLPAELAALISQYGWPTVKTNGILPWATVWALDSLTAQMHSGDWNRAYQTAADLGHYVADGHQPLHCTINYDGYQTGNNGIHSRYESSMIDQYQAFLVVAPDTVRYIADPYSYVLNSELHARLFVDSILQADNDAKAASGWNGSGSAPQAYYAALWQNTQHFTLQLMQEATSDLASLWFTAWQNAGLNTTSAVNAASTTPNTFALAQNFPNPFNPTTTIRYTLPFEGNVSLTVFDVMGRRIADLATGRQIAGTHETRFIASGLASGTYFYRLSVVPTARRDLASIGDQDGQAGEFVLTRKLLLVR